MSSLKYLKLTLLIGLLLFALRPLFSTGLPITHDGVDHVFRVANFYQNLKEGNLIPRWAGNLNWGWGHPVLMFLYPLPSYAASLFHSAGFSYINSVKAVFALTYVLSGLAMYLWIREIYGDTAGLLAGLLYSFAPYRFVNLYVRGAFGEHTALMFPPLILYFLSKLLSYRTWRNFLGVSLSTAGLILSHNAVSLMFLPVIAGYILIKKIDILSIFTIIMGFGLSVFYWLPAFAEGKYTLRDIVTKDEYAKRFVDISDLLYGQWNYGISGQFTVQIGAVQIVFIIAGILLLIRLRMRKKRIDNFFPFSIFIFGLAVFLMLPASNFIWEKVMILQNFQFPWRFLNLTVFMIPVIAAAVIKTVPQKKQSIILFFTALLLFIFNKDFIKAKGYFFAPDSYFESVYAGTTDTGESSPLWSVRFMEQAPAGHLEILEGEAVVKELSRSSTAHVYEVEVKSPEARLKENTLYFPGWTVFGNDIKIPVQFQDRNYHGIMTFNLSGGRHYLKVIFTETKLRSFSLLVSIVSIPVFFLVMIKNKEA